VNKINQQISTIDLGQNTRISSLNMFFNYLNIKNHLNSSEKKVHMFDDKNLFGTLKFPPMLRKLYCKY
jgi:hypothetical protein